MNPESPPKLESAAALTGPLRPAVEPAGDGLVWVLLSALAVAALVGLGLCRWRKDSRSEKQRLLVSLQELDREPRPAIEKLVNVVQGFFTIQPNSAVWQRVTTARFAPVEITMDEWRGLLVEIREFVEAGENR